MSGNELSTADACDQFSDKVQLVDPTIQWRWFGQKRAIRGFAATVRCLEDNSKPGNGRVLVVDGGGSFNCALVGDQLGQLCITNNWAGIIVYGCIRDANVLNAMDVGVLALGTNPRKSNRANRGDCQVPVTIGGREFLPDATWVTADGDGILLSTSAL
ncbi:ribonuclease activity regulator protein RraA [Capsaspora owczarzaki ATCC 30864]|uniref:ribonuclease activity regulator protein RraA n=1 Tax=Capsaspora owczarzaki (strain ATCC 30864) TaxID=595528 RepID=UPI0001FE3BB7|nr:ribonuclease activity regulator protein RraA [Capsaspora owczarzaki ATCC 30864]|eukprot:XP_004347998.1 ribonuclease activity regulator protein RraA [Capsaspora owczarzaki ATCC 30864]